MVKRLSILFFFAPFALLAQIPTGAELLQKSIHYHDPEGTWGSQKHVLQLTETRPGGKDRKTTVEIDLNEERFNLDQLREGQKIYQEINKGECKITLDGKEEISESDKEKFRLTCDRATLLRDYYTYLWGLPMKLKDPGTQIAEKVVSDNFQGKECWAMKVTYTAEVGDDIWYFYFDKGSYALIGYRFYHEEEKNDGEYITLDGETKLGKMRLPKTRKWFINKDDRFLGADILDEIR